MENLNLGFSRGDTKMAEIIIYYNRKRKPDEERITVRVGTKAIHTNNLVLKNITGTVSYDQKTQGYNVKRYGIACPLVIPIVAPLTRGQLAYRKKKGSSPDPSSKEDK